MCIYANLHKSTWSFSYTKKAGNTYKFCIYEIVVSLTISFHSFICRFNRHLLRYFTSNILNYRIIERKVAL